MFEVINNDCSGKNQDLFFESQGFRIQLHPDHEAGLSVKVMSTDNPFLMESLFKLEVTSYGRMLTAE